MKKNILWRLLLIGVTVILAVIFFLPNTPVFQHMPEWWKKSMPDKGIVLGWSLLGRAASCFRGQEGDKADRDNNRTIRGAAEGPVGKEKPAS